MKLYFTTIHESTYIILDCKASTTMFKSKSEALNGSYTKGSKETFQLAAVNSSIDSFGQGTIPVNEVTLTNGVHVDGLHESLI